MNMEYKVRGSKRMRGRVDSTDLHARQSFRLISAVCNFVRAAWPELDTS